MTQALQSEELGPRPHSASPLRSSPGPVSTVRRSSRSRRLGPAPRIPYTLAIGPALLLALWALSSWAGWLDARVLSKPWIVVATTRELLVDGRLHATWLSLVVAEQINATSGIGYMMSLARSYGQTACSFW